MDELGLVSDRFTVAHGVWLDDDDMKRLGDRGASVAHNPGSNMRLGNGLADVRGMLNAQGQCRRSAPTAPTARTIRTCTRRCGSPPSSPRSRGRTCEHWLTTEEALRAATEGSARALGLDKQIGRIAPGYKADIVFLDLHHINWIPINDPVNQLVHTEDGSGRAFGDDRRPHGRSRTASCSPSTSPKLAAKAAASQARRAKLDGRRRRSSTSGWRRSSARSAPASPRRRCTSTATAPATTPLKRSASHSRGHASDAHSDRGFRRFVPESWRHMPGRDD